MLSLIAEGDQPPTWDTRGLLWRKDKGATHERALNTLNCLLNDQLTGRQVSELTQHTNMLVHPSLLVEERIGGMI